MRKTFATALLLAVGIASAPQALAQTQQMHEVCTAKWEDAPATDYCSQHTMHWEEPNPGQTNGCVLAATCSVDVTIGEEERTFDRVFGVQAEPDDMATLELCFREWEDPLAIDGWVLFIKLSCSDQDVDVDTAVADGLSP